MYLLCGACRLWAGSVDLQERLRGATPSVQYKFPVPYLRLSA